MASDSNIANFPLSIFQLKSFSSHGENALDPPLQENSALILMIKFERLHTIQLIKKDSCLLTHGQTTIWTVSFHEKRRTIGDRYALMPLLRPRKGKFRDNPTFQQFFFLKKILPNPSTSIYKFQIQVFRHGTKLVTMLYPDACVSQPSLHHKKQHKQ